VITWRAPVSIERRRNQFRNADQIVGDQIEHEVGGDAADTAMFSLAHRTVLLAPTEDAFDHGAARLRHSIAFILRGAFVDGALATFAVFGGAIVLCIAIVLSENSIR
jgi:hypothetical protein